MEDFTAVFQELRNKKKRTITFKILQTLYDTGKISAKNINDFLDQALANKFKISDRVSSAAEAKTDIVSYLKSPSEVPANVEDLLAMYIKDMRNLKMLNDKDLKMLVKRYREQNDLDAWRQVTEANLKLVISVALKYRSYGVPLMDIISEGNIGLMRAIEHFDYNKKFKFSTYAMWWIMEAARKAATVQSNVIRLPLNAIARIYKIKKIKNELKRRNGKEPSVDEIAEKAELPRQKVVRLLGFIENVVSLENTPDSDSKYDYYTFISDSEENIPENILIEAIRKNTMTKLINSLKDNERDVLIKRYGLDGGEKYTLNALGLIYNVSKERIRQLELRAIKKLQKKISENNLADLFRET